MQLKENKQLWEKYQKNAQFHQQMNKKSQKLKQFQQLSLYLESQQTSRNMIVGIKREDDENWCCKLQERTNVTVVLGCRQPSGTKSIENILLNTVKFLPRPSQNYSIVYINTLASSNAYSDFKSILEFLPIQYLHRLDRILVLQAHFKNRASYWWSFDSLTNFLKCKTVHADTLKEVTDRTKLRINPFLEILPPQIVSALSAKEQVVREYLTSKESQIIYNSNVYNPKEQTYIEHKPKPKLAKHLPKKNTIESYELGQTGAPLTIQLLISYFNGKEELLNEEGIFRKSVSVEEQTALLMQLSKGNYDSIQQVKNPHLIANAIKRFLSNLDEPIIPFKEFALLTSINQSQYKQNITAIINKLGNNRKMVLLLLVDFFKEKLLPRTKFNKMTQNSLSIVFAPCLMRSEVPSINDLIYTKKSIAITLIIFQDCDNIFGGKKERQTQIRKSIQLQQRESFLSRLKNTEQNKDILQPKQKQQQKELQIQKKEHVKEECATDNILNGIFKMMEDQISHKQIREQQEMFEPMLIRQGQTHSKGNVQREV